MEDVPIHFNQEVQFKGYTDSSRSGPCINLRLDDRDLLEKFVGMEGRRFRCLLVLLNDREEPEAPPPTRTKRKAAAETLPPAPPPPPAKRERMAPLCEWAVKACSDKNFQDWASHQHEAGGGQFKFTSLQEEAKGVILSLCGVASRKELDTDPAAAKRFHERVRLPYQQWLESQRVPA